ncbi:MAG: WG repeat-containing protein [Bacteroidales bacterium]|nr:WG repeat-containing protein [Bacteroidales bacterium]
MRHSTFILSGICALVLCSCKGNINDKGFETLKVTTSDGIEYLFFSDPENGVGLADAQGDVIIEGQFDYMEHIMRGNEGDCLRVVNIEDVEYSDKERKRSGYYIESRRVRMTGMYDFEGKEILPVQFSNIDVYPGNLFLTTSVPSVSGATFDRIYKGSDYVAMYDDIRVSPKGTAAMGFVYDSDSGRRLPYLINPLTKEAYSLGKINGDYQLGDHCLVYRRKSYYDNVMGMDGQLLLPEDTYEEIKLADGDYLLCNIYDYGMSVFHSSDPATPLLQSGVYEDFIRIPGVSGVFLVREEMPETRGKAWRFEWRYGLIDANGNEIIPKKYVDAEIESDIIRFRIPGTWKYDEISIAELASNHAVEK